VRRKRKEHSSKETVEGGVRSYLEYRKHAMMPHIKEDTMSGMRGGA